MITRKATSIDFARTTDVLPVKFVLDFMRSVAAEPDFFGCWVVIENKKVVAAVFAVFNPTTKGIEIVQFYTLKTIKLLDYVFKKLNEHWPEAQGIALLGSSTHIGAFADLGFDAGETTFFKPLTSSIAVQPTTAEAEAR